MAVCAFVSFRLGLTDGVSVVARNWQRAMEQLGFTTYTVAGEGPVDRTVPGLEIEPTRRPDEPALADALDDADVVVVENLCTIPLNLPAARAVANVLRGRPAIMHHHDPPWQRERFRTVTELPLDDPQWRHVTINQLTQREMQDRGFTATCIYNGFPTPTTIGDRGGVRERMGISETEILLAHPVRAIARKDIPAAVDLAEKLDATYWLWGQAEEGYGDRLRMILEAARCRVIRGTGNHQTLDLYGAADAVVFPSTWEGFGNPPIEAAMHRVPAAVGPYPVKAELVDLGMRWLPTDDPEPLRRVLAHPDPDTLDHNRRVAMRHFSLESMQVSIRAVLAEAGWIP